MLLALKIFLERKKVRKKASMPDWNGYSFLACLDRQVSSLGFPEHIGRQQTVIGPRMD
jgi:hypothetical protein